MDQGFFRRVSSVVDQLLDLPAAERSRRLAELCAGDGELEREAAAWLAADLEATGPLDGGVERYAPTAVDAVAGSMGEGAAGRLVGPYRLLRELGQGGMGEVFLAARADGQFAQQVALKLIRRGMGSAEVLRRFLAERQILAGLSHPSIARLLDGGVSEEGQPYFAMEHVDGVPITRYCAEESLGLEALLRLFAQVCAAVAYAHRNLVVHRDLKPSNVLVTPGGEVKLVDFGIAKVLGGEAGEPPATRLGARPMTPEYAAPEQVRGEAVTTATDVYGLGVILYELLAGERPFSAAGRTPGELEDAILQSPPRRPSTVVRRRAQDEGGAVPAPGGHRRLEGDLDTLVLTALHKEPERRYPSAAALADEIERYLAGLPLLARPDTFGYRARKFLRRHRWGAAAGALLLLSLLAGILATAWQAGVARREAAKQRLVRDFLVSLFEVSDPDASQGEAISARTLLDRGAQRIEGELAAEPELAAEMLALVGDLYRRLGVYDQAGALLEQDLRLRTGLFGAESAETADSLGRLAALRLATGDLDEGERLLRRALALNRTRRGAGALETARAEKELGQLLTARGETAAAAPLFEHSLAVLAATAGRESEDYADALDAKARMLASAGDFAAAEPLFAEALGIRRQHFGERHTRVVASLSNLAVVYQARGDDSRAEELFREILARDEELYGSDHPEVARDLCNLGATLNRLGRYEEAEPLLRRALALGAGFLAADNPQLAVYHHNLGVALRGRGESAEAVALLRRALLLTGQLVGEGHPLLARAQTSLAWALADAGEGAEAEELFRRAAVSLRGGSPAPEPVLAEALAGWGRLLSSTGRGEQAAPLLAEAAAILEQAYGEENPETRRIAGLLGLPAPDGAGAAAAVEPAAESQ